SAAVGSASRSASSSASASRTLRTPASLAAASAAALAPLPATSTSTSPPIFEAAVSALAVWSERVALSCSATRRMAMSVIALFGGLKNAVRLEARHQLGDVLDLDARLAADRLLGLQHLEPRRDVDAVIGGGLLVERLLLGLHDVGQRGVARLVEPQVRRHHRRQLDLDHLQAAV